MGNCYNSNHGDKPSKQKNSGNKAEGKIVVMTFAASSIPDFCESDPQPPTFSDPNNFKESRSEFD